MSAFRIPAGGRIDRDTPLVFTFDGKRYSGLSGDTLASALLANGVSLVGRSFKYHRPRGIYSAGIEEPNALVTLGAQGRREPNIPATTVELADGLVAQSQNRWPSLRFDAMAVNSLLSPFFAAGFYYKTFMGPTRRSWLFYEHFIRRAAGLGGAGREPDPDRYETRHGFCDVLVIGAGPAGMAAALAAGRSGARTVLVEQDFLLGGGLLREPAAGGSATWLADRLVDLRSLPKLRIMSRTTAFGLYDGGVVGLLESRGHDSPAPGSGRARQSLVLMRAGAIVFATGAIERPLVFADNDRPGVMLASAARTYLNRFGVLVGRKAVVATGNDSAYHAAADLARAGAHVVLLDSRFAPGQAAAQAAREAGVEVRAGTAIGRVLGRRRATAVETHGGAGFERLACELVCVSGGWSPALHLTSHLGVKPRWREDIEAFVPGPFAADHFGAGAVTGALSTAEAVEQGIAAGASAAARCGFVPAAEGVVAPPDDLPGARSGTAARHRFPARGKAFVDLQNDVTVDDIRLAHQEGYESVEHLKRYTTLGMGTDQGKTSNLNALLAMADLRRRPVPEVGTTTFRPPYTPVAIGALAGRAVGREFRPIRRTPMHDWHVANGAEMIEVGLWYRPYFYRSAGSDVGEAYVNEMRCVRERAGLMDISTLGKIDIQGPDAVEFLNRVYVNGWSKLAVNRARYGVMLRDDGIVLDDGTTTRIGEQRFFMTTSTAKAAEVMSWLEFLLQTAWTELRVDVTSVSDDWAAMSLAGPQSRAILAAALPSLDLSDGALPHMGALQSVTDGACLRILRLSYSGERAYEIYVPADRGTRFWERLMRAGEPFGLRPYGVEALGALRVEKGHVAGPEIDGRTTLDDLGLEKLASQAKPFVGSVLARRPAFLAAGRQRLVGLECLEAGRRLRSGAILFHTRDPLSGHGRGRVTSVTYSPTLGRYVGLGLFEGGLGCSGEEVVAAYPMKNETVRARIVSPVFLDPQGVRLHG